MPRIFLTHIPEMLTNYYGQRAVNALRELGEVRFNPGADVLDARTLAEAARGCEIIVSDRQTPAPAEFFVQAPDVVAFLRCAIDIRNIDVAAASQAGVLVTQATAGFLASVSEVAIGFMVDLGRNITDSVTAYRTDREPEVRMGRQLNGATVGIIGYGAIGAHLAPICLALGMKVLISDPFKRANDPAFEQVELAALLERSDYVVCLAIANEQTENLMNADAFARMKRSAFFINMSRGNLVDEAALERALDERRIAGAAMDVGRAPDQRPSLLLARRPDVIATPHIAGLTPEAAEHQAFDTVKQVRALVAGNVPSGAVNAAAAHRLVRLGISV
jgi:D-3-phosphoglycerate dehydrogenase / 2-oxoglutarate reductase